MTDRDSAFLWETEALRSGPPRHQRGSGASLIEAAGWVTLREASDITGVPADTIRKWARHERIPSYLEKTDDGHLRIVSLDGIRGWSEAIGRDIDAEAAAADQVEVVVDLDLDQPSRPLLDEPRVPEGSMLVPLDAWNKMLHQLGNLHEAGQQLAEARERAAKAETEARFLKERLAELRAEMDRSRGPDEEDVPGEPSGETRSPGPSSTLGGTAASLARRLYADWRRRRRA